MISKRMRHFRRYREIASILVRHGFGYVVQEMGLFQILSLPKRLLAEKQEIDPSSVNIHIRQVLEELGPTFIKVGQMASTRPDIFPQEIIVELEKLQDNVPPFTIDEVRGCIFEEFGEDIEEVFLDFIDTPLAAASIGQVHKARLKNGQDVAVKIQRPQIEQRIETDLSILFDLAAIAERRLEWAEMYKLTEIVEEFARAIRSELDYTREGRNAERIAKQFRNDHNIHIPEIYWDYTTKTVLTMEYMNGIKLNQKEVLLRKGIDYKKLSENLIKALFHQILIAGFFHADPHPGNIIVSEKDEKVSFIDFGMIGRLTPDMKYHFASLVIAMMRQNTEDILRAVFKMGLVPDNINLHLLRRDVEELREKYLDVPLSKINLGEAINDLFAVAFRYRIRIPADLTLLAKSLLTLEGVVSKLDPDISIIDIAEPFGRQLLMERYHPEKITEKVWRNILEYSDLIIEFPQQIKGIIKNARQGHFNIQVGIPEMDSYLRKLDRISNQISFSIVLLSFSIIMTGLIIATALGRQPIIIWHIPAVEVGLGFAALMFLWLIFAIFKSGKF